jgi:iron complex transport system ATP-binding protein
MIDLDVQNIALRYNHAPVVQGLSFRVRSGEMVGLIGPNGCGKTSIIKALSRILALQSGQIRLDGRELHLFARSELARLIGVVPQNPSLPDTFTVSEVVLLGRNPHLGWLRTESARDMAIAGWAMERTGITSLAGRRLGELSGGERQRVTIARVLAQEPRAILLDEPTANLDINHQMGILDLIKGLCRERDLAVLIALHDLNLAAQYCDRLLLLSRGKVFAEGPPPAVITAANIMAVYGAESLIYPHPENQLPVVLVRAKHNAGVEAGGNKDRKQERQ